MNNIQIFKYENNDVRTVELNGEPWFALKDVCAVLGISNHKMTAQRLDADEVILTDLTDSMGRQQETTVINESGLYNVILRSDKPEAKPFRKWVTSEVLPSIRKNGGYIAGQEQLTFYFEPWLKREREKAERFAEKRNCSDYYRYNGNSVCTLCTGIGILCILLSFLGTALR